MSLTLEELNMIVNASVKDAATKKAILDEAKQLEEDKKAEREDSKGPKAKNKHTVFIRCAPEHEKILRESSAFVLKSPQDTPDESLIGLIKETALVQNRKAKRKGKINTWAEWFRFIKGPNRKEQKINNVTKEPVQVIPLVSEEIDFSK